MMLLFVPTLRQTGPNRYATGRRYVLFLIRFRASISSHGASWLILTPAFSLNRLIAPRSAMPLMDPFIV